MADDVKTINRGDFGVDLNSKAEDAASKKLAENWSAELKTAFSDGQGFLSGFSSLFDNNVKVKKGALDAALQKVTADASDPEALAKYQAALAEYTLYRNAQSNAVKAYKDVDANTIRNFN
ncbi:MAG TPA: type III secretion system needle filament subunit SctF [Herbaspirillum sp.]|jgi:type III secretion protein F